MPECLVEIAFALRTGTELTMRKRVDLPVVVAPFKHLIIAGDRHEVVECDYDYERQLPILYTKPITAMSGDPHAWFDTYVDRGFRTHWCRGNGKSQDSAHHFVREIYENSKYHEQLDAFLALPENFYPQPNPPKAVEPTNQSDPPAVGRVYRRQDPNSLCNLTWVQVAGFSVEHESGATPYVFVRCFGSGATDSCSRSRWNIAGWKLVDAPYIS